MQLTDVREAKQCTPWSGIADSQHGVMATNTTSGLVHGISVGYFRNKLPVYKLERNFHLTYHDKMQMPQIQHCHKAFSTCCYMVQLLN